MTTQKKDVRVTIRLSSHDYEMLKCLSKLTYKSASVSRLIRHYLEPVIKTFDNSINNLSTLNN